MNLRWKAFEKGLDKRVEPYDARRRMSFWRRLQHWQSVAVQVGWFRILPTAVLAGIALCNTRAMINHPAGWLAGISLWGLLVTIGRTGTIWGAARLDPEYRLTWVLPLSPERIYRRLRRRIVAGGVFLFLDFLIVYGALASGHEDPTVTWVGVLTCAALQAGFSLVLTFLLVAVRINPAWLEQPLIILLCFFSLGFPWLVNNPPLLNVLQTCNPLAWVNGMYWDGWIRGSAGAFGALLPVSLAFGAIPYSLRVLRQLHRQGAFKEIHAQGTGLFLKKKVEAAAAPIDLAAERQRILAGDFDQPVPLTEQGFVERLVARFLTPQERTLLEWVLIRPRQWSTAFGDCLAYLVLFLATDTLVGSGAFKSLLKTFLSRDERWYLLNVLWIASLVFAGMMLFKSLSCWLDSVLIPCVVHLPEYNRPLTTTINTGPRDRPYRSFRLWPKNYWEVAATIAKATTVLTLLLGLLLVILDWSLLSQVFQGDKTPIRSFPLKCLLLGWGLPLMVSSVSWGVSYLTGFKHWRSYIKTTLAFILTLALWGLMLANRGWTDVLWAGAFILTVLLWFLYCGVRYRKGLPL